MDNSLNRFLLAQKVDYDRALEEIKSGLKVSHWIWYVFPQVKGLGPSYNSEYYGIASLEEAKLYLKDPILSERLYTITKELLKHKDKNIVSIVGRTDAQKIKSCMTLFDFVSPNDVFKTVLEVFFDGTMCKRTLRFINN